VNNQCVGLRRKHKLARYTYDEYLNIVCLIIVIELVLNYKFVFFNAMKLYLNKKI
jgi:hypothetical protein